MTPPQAEASAKKSSRVVCSRQFDVLAAQDLVQQGLGDRRAGNISWNRMRGRECGSLPGKAQGPVVIPRKADAAAH